MRTYRCEAHEAVVAQHKRACICVVRGIGWGNGHCDLRVGFGLEQLLSSDHGEVAKERKVWQTQAALNLQQASEGTSPLAQ